MKFFPTNPFVNNMKFVYSFYPYLERKTQNNTYLWQDLLQKSEALWIEYLKITNKVQLTFTHMLFATLKNPTDRK